jgi:peroxiredoxin
MVAAVSRMVFGRVADGVTCPTVTVMPRTDNLYELPPNLPVPVDDGACRHLPGLSLPDFSLPSTSGRRVSLAAASRESRVVVYAYPRTGKPDQEMPAGWNAIPGARGCTPQSCGFRDHHAELRRLGAQVFGLSTQDSDYQREVVERLHLPFEILSDADLRLTTALRLPTFEVAGMTLMKRLTVVLAEGRIEKVFYPVFPPDKSAADVVAWLRQARGAGS